MLPVPELGSPPVFEFPGYRLAKRCLEGGKIFALLCVSMDTSELNIYESRVHIERHELHLGSLDKLFATLAGP